MNTTSKDESFPLLGPSQCSTVEINLSQQPTPRAANVSQDKAMLDTIADENVTELLRVSVLYMEGISSPHIPDEKISAWVGFRSSFPSSAMSISSSNYSSFFLKEGNLLAVESDQVKWTPSGDESDCKSSYSGIAFWNSVENAVNSRAHDLEVNISSRPIPQSNDEHENIDLPDIIEFHICIVHEIEASQEDDATTESAKLPSKKSSALNSKWDNEMEEVHWYKDDDEEQGSNDHHVTAHSSLERQLQHGVAHLKVHHNSNDNMLGSDGRIIHLPIRMIPSRLNPSKDHGLYLDHAATLTIQADKRRVQNELTQEQRHYVTNAWNGGQQCAPPSVKCNDDSSKEEAPKNKPLARHFTFDTIKSMLTGIKSTDKAEQLSQKVIIEDSQPSKETLGRMQDAFDSSFKSMNDSKKLAAAMRQQRQHDPISPDRNATPLPREITPTKQQKNELALDNNLLIQSNNGADSNINGSNLATTPLKSNTRVQQQNDVSRQQSHQITSTPKKSMMSRMLCGADLADVMLHCDEDHVGMYVADSMSLSSINT